MEVKIMKAKLFFPMMLVLLLWAPYGSAWTIDDMVSYWSFDEGQGTIAYDSVGDNDGAINGATWTTGQINGALSFDGVNDYVDLPDTVKNYLGTSYTFSIWIKPKAIPGIHCIAAYRRSTLDIGYQTLLQLQHNNSDVQFIVGSLGNNAIASYPDALTTNTWYNIVGIREGNLLNVYVNGVSGIPDSETFGEISPDNFKVGAIHCCDQVIQSFFNGTIDDVMIFDRALSDQEILEIYYTGMGDTEWTVGVPVMAVNTEYAEWDPFLSADGLSLYYSKGKTNTFYFHRLYQAMRQEPFGPFTSIKEISELNYSGGHIQDPWVSSDNLRLYYMRTEPGNYWRLKFSERAAVDDPWPVGVNISELNVLNQMLRSPTLTADELTIFFSSFPTNPIPGGEGGDDIWMATRPDRYSPFGNITNQIGINSTANEGGPSVSPDGLTIVFDFHNNGPAQLFKATRESLTQPFGNIEHMWACDTPGGSSANPCLSSDGSAIYYRSHTATRSTDIYVSYLAEKNPYEIAIISIKDAIAEKLDALERIEVAMEKEWAAYDALKELLDTGDYGDLNKGDIVAAMQKIHSSIQHQQQSIDALQKSIEKLLYSLSTLGYGPQPPGSNWPPNVTITQPEDGAEFTPEDTIEIEASALDFDGSVVMMEFFANGSKIAEDTDGSDGWTTSWSDHPEGTYSLTATATDNEAAATTSEEVVITVFVPPPPPPGPPLPPHP